MTGGARRYTTLEVEAICCAWEWMLDQRDGLLRAEFERSGTVAMRHTAIDAGTAIERWFAEWCALDLRNRDSLSGHPYDWEIVPAMMEIYVAHGSSNAGRAACFARLDEIGKPRRKARSEGQN